MIGQDNDVGCVAHISETGAISSIGKSVMLEFEMKQPLQILAQHHFLTVFSSAISNSSVCIFSRDLLLLPVSIKLFDRFLMSMISESLIG